MKHIYLNLKRFDIPAAMNGVNRLAPVTDWARAIVSDTAEGLAKYDPAGTEFVQFYPEAHLLNAVAAGNGGPVHVGCQGVYRQDVTPGGNFGAFTTNLPASAARALGCTHALIGHCEERMALKGVLAAAGIRSAETVNTILNAEVRCAVNAGLKTVFCIGETEEEYPWFEEVLTAQLEQGLADVESRETVIAYEPVWSIGPGKTPAGREHIARVASLVKRVTGGLDVVYGGGLKAENAEMLASIPEIDGGLIALTRFIGEIGFYPDEYLEIIKKYLGR